LRGVWLAAALGLLPGQARAEIAVLANGQTLKVSEHRFEGEVVLLTLVGGGVVGTAAAQLRGVVPDEIEDVMREVQASLGDDREALVALARAIAADHGLAPELVLAVVTVESGFRPEAVSPKGAQGLMQLMPSTAAALGVEDAFDPEANLSGGVRHLRDLLQRYQGDLPRALAAYNAGEGAVERHRGIPPYAETRAYVREVLRLYRGAP